MPEHEKVGSLDFGTHSLEIVIKNPDKEETNMSMPKTIGELKALIADLDDDTPIRGQFQGEEHWDWMLFLEPAGEGPEEQADQDVFVVSMDL